MSTEFFEVRGYYAMKELGEKHVLDTMDSFPVKYDFIELAAADTINSKISPRLVLKGLGGAVTLTSTPHISTPSAPTRLLLEGGHATETIELQSETSHPGSGLLLAGGADALLALGDTLLLQYSPQAGAWIEISRSLLNA